MIEDFNTVEVTAKVLKADRKTVYGAIERKKFPAFGSVVSSVCLEHG